MSSAPFEKHRPVLLKEVIECLDPRPGQRFVDMTVGGGGHTRALLEAVGPEGFVFGIDRDPELLAETVAELRDEGYGEERFRAAAGNFRDVDVLLESESIGAFDGFVCDLGASSPHFDRPERGFSFREPGPLDMRYDRSGGITLKEVLEELDETGLRRALRDYGEERFAGRIARAIIAARDAGGLTDTAALAEAIRGAYPGAARRASRIDPATRSFQALRILTNDELESVRVGLAKVLNGMRRSARLAAIGFQSLELRIVKQLFRSVSEGVKDSYGQRGAAPARELTRKAIAPQEAEKQANPRSKAAKLRAIEKLVEGEIVGGAGNAK